MKNWYKRASDLFFYSIFVICLTAPAFGQLNMFRKTMDFDGDGKADFAVTRDVEGLRYWYVLQSTQGFRGFQFGISTDENAPGDFDGDGKTDPAIFRTRPTTYPGDRIYDFWVLGSAYGVRDYYRTINDYGPSVATQQDYDGDNRTDVSYTLGYNVKSQVFFVWTSFSGTYSLSCPDAACVKIGDISGDGKADPASYSAPVNVLSVRMPDGNIRRIPFGVAGDQFVQADFDGDGKGEIAVFRQSNGTWWWISSTDNTMRAAQFGQPGDVPVPADYDGDGKTDLAIWRSGSQGVYWVYGSQSGVFAVAWGMTGDSAVHF